MFQVRNKKVANLKWWMCSKIAIKRTSHTYRTTSIYVVLVVLLSSSLAFNIFPKLIRFFIEKLENGLLCKEKMLEKQILFSSNTLTTLIRCLF